jgi:AbrB family looped-hinge helix DNA binding protein
VPPWQVLNRQRRCEGHAAMRHQVAFDVARQWIVPIGERAHWYNPANRPPASVTVAVERQTSGIEGDQLIRFKTLPQRTTWSHETCGDCAQDCQCHRIWHMASWTGIKLTIDKSGRIVVPKPLRERLGLKPGTELEVLDQQGGVLLRTVEERPALVKIDGLWVHRGVAQPGANWDRVIQEVREERVESLLKA